MILSGSLAAILEPVANQGKNAEGADRSGLEPLLRYCARPPFAPQLLLAPARDPPAWEQATRLHRDDIPPPAPEVAFDQRVSW